MHQKNPPYPFAKKKCHFLFCLQSIKHRKSTLSKLTNPQMEDRAEHCLFFLEAGGVCKRVWLFFFFFFE